VDPPGSLVAAGATTNPLYVIADACDAAVATYEAVQELYRA
jgi:hypothetical protein